MGSLLTKCNLYFVEWICFVLGMFKLIGLKGMCCNARIPLTKPNLIAKILGVSVYCLSCKFICLVGRVFPDWCGYVYTLGEYLMGEACFFKAFFFRWNVTKVVSATARKNVTKMDLLVLEKLKALSFVKGT